MKETIVYQRKRLGYSQWYLKERAKMLRRDKKEPASLTEKDIIDFINSKKKGAKN